MDTTLVEAEGTSGVKTSDSAVGQDAGDTTRATHRRTSAVAGAGG